ncbi:MAG: hypothetical protein ACK4HE_07425 [Chitinophagaceae bacterium]
MTRLLLFIGCILHLTVNAQYYYSDIITPQQVSKNYKTLVTAQVKKMKAKSFENDNSETANFILEQTLNTNKRELKTTSSYVSTGTSVSISCFAANQQLQSSYDSSGNIVVKVSYRYNEHLLQSITTETTDAFMGSYTKEEHIWEYNNGLPTRMYKIKDGKDTTLVKFVQDEQQRIAEERWYKKGKEVEAYFYYYSDTLLTDIVRFNAKVKRMLPDFLFEYNAQQQLIQLTQIMTGTSNYMTWKYYYNEKGLKVADVCYNKQQQLVGKVEYLYEF